MTDNSNTRETVRQLLVDAIKSDQRLTAPYAEYVHKAQSVAQELVLLVANAAKLNELKFMNAYDALVDKHGSTLVYTATKLILLNLAMAQDTAQ